MISGAAVTILWKQLVEDPASTGITGLYEIVPGFAVALVLGVVVSLATHKPSERIDREFDEARELATAR